VGQGTVSDALAKDRTLFEEVTKMNEVLQKAETTERTAEPVAPEKRDTRTDGKLTVPEEVQLGHVSWSSFKMYIGRLGGIPVRIFTLPF